MNILMALSQLEVTGAEVYAATLGNELTKRGHRVFYISDTLSVPAQGIYIPIRFNKRSWPRRIWQIVKLVWIIKKHRIQLVHAHSRAAGWSCYIACRLTKTPMVTTVHGRQPVHRSRKTFHALGFRAIAVCEDIKTQVVCDLGVPAENVTVIRNPVNPEQFPFGRVAQNQIASVSIIGRLTGPKGDLCYRLLEEVLEKLVLDDQVRVQVISGSKIPGRFEKFQKHITFLDFQNNLAAVFQTSGLIIGAGRVAIEALMAGAPIYAIGEAKAIGLIDQTNLDHALKSNFGDIGPKELEIDLKAVRSDLINIISLINQASDKTLLRLPGEDRALRERILAEFDASTVTNQIETVYQDAVVFTLKQEMPILMYHRFVEHESEKGIHGTWIDIKRFERHLKLIKKLGFETLTFKDLKSKGLLHRFEAGKRFLMITADDGYKDNLTRLTPLLEKYDMKAVVFIVSNETHNRWDTENTNNPDTKVMLLTKDEVRMLDKSGRIEIGGHTLTHAKLDELDIEAQRQEICQNKNDLESMVDHPIISFAYPYGVLNESAKKEAQAAGYDFAVATDSGPKALHQDLFQIRRIAVFPRTTTFGLWRKIRGNYVWRRT